MVCKNCGATINKSYDMHGNILVCPECGKQYMIKESKPKPQPPVMYEDSYPASSRTAPSAHDELPYGTDPRYMTAWSYFWHDVLYMLPIIGLIFLIIHSFQKGHENRCHFARSHFIPLFLMLIIAAIVAVAIVIIILTADQNTDIAFLEPLEEIFR